MTPTPPTLPACKNTHCSRPFTARSNKLFCSLRCKNKYHNDRARDPLSPQVQKNKRLKANEDILVRIALKMDLKKVPRAILEYEGYDFNYFIGRTINPTTKTPVHWIYGLGIEKNKEAGTYTIHIVPLEP